MLKIFVLVAGVASIATSAATWRKPGNSVPVELQFSRERPEGVSLRVKVTSNYDSWIAVRSNMFPQSKIVAMAGEIEGNQVTPTGQPELPLEGREWQTIFSKDRQGDTESKIEVHTYAIRFVQVEKQDATISMELSAGTGGMDDEIPADAFVSMEILP